MGTTEPAGQQRPDNERRIDSPHVSRRVDHERLDRAIFGLMLEDVGRLWQVDDLVTAIGDQETVVAALRRLRSDGVIDLDGEGARVTRAAVRAVDLLEV